MLTLILTYTYNIYIYILTYVNTDNSLNIVMAMISMSMLDGSLTPPQSSARCALRQLGDGGSQFEPPSLLRRYMYVYIYIYMCIM